MEQNKNRNKQKQNNGNKTKRKTKHTEKQNKNKRRRTEQKTKQKENKNKNLPRGVSFVGACTCPAQTSPPAQPDTTKSRLPGSQPQIGPASLPVEPGPRRAQKPRRRKLERETCLSPGEGPGGSQTSAMLLRCQHRTARATTRRRSPSFASSNPSLSSAPSQLGALKIALPRAFLRSVGHLAPDFLWRAPALRYVELRRASRRWSVGGTRLGHATTNGAPT